MNYEERPFEDVVESTIVSLEIARERIERLKDRGWVIHFRSSHFDDGATGPNGEPWQAEVNGCHGWGDRITTAIINALDAALTEHKEPQ